MQCNAMTTPHLYASHLDDITCATIVEKPFLSHTTDSKEEARVRNIKMMRWQQDMGEEKTATPTGRVIDFSPHCELQRSPTHR